MKTKIFHNSTLLFFLGISSVWAAMPVAPGSKGTASLGYAFVMDGSYITAAKVSSHLWTHRLEYAYAPWEYLEIGLGLGAASFDVKSSDITYFDGDRSFSPAAHLALSTPAVFREMFRLRLQGDIASFENEDGRVDYSARVYDGTGMLVWQHKCWQVELGAGAYWIDGEMGSPTSDAGYSNYYLGRGLVNIQYTGRHGGFVRLNMQGNSNTKGWHDGPTESRVGVLLGYQLRAPSTPMVKQDLDRYFPAVPKMRAQQKNMEAELDKPAKTESKKSR